jgi:hypothetical protein
MIILKSKHEKILGSIKASMQDLKTIKDLENNLLYYSATSFTLINAVRDGLVEKQKDEGLQDEVLGYWYSFNGSCIQRHAKYFSQGKFNEKINAVVLDEDINNIVISIYKLGDRTSELVTEYYKKEVYIEKAKLLLDDYYNAFNRYSRLVSIYFR